MAAVERILLEFGERGAASVNRALSLQEAKLRSLINLASRLSRQGVIGPEAQAQLINTTSAIRQTVSRTTALRTALDAANRAAKVKSVTLQDISGKVSSFAQNIGAAANRVIHFAFTMGALGAGVIRATAELSKLGGRAIVSEQQFGNTARTLGTTADTLLPRLQGALLGSASTFDTMRLANFALASGLKVSGDELVRLAAASSRLALVHGRDTTEAFERLTFGIVKQERRILDELGIVVRARDIFEDYAKSIGKSAAALSAQEKLQGFFKTTLAAAEAQVESFTGVNFEAASVGEKVSVAFRQFTQDLGKLFIESGAAARILQVVKTALDAFIDRVRDPEGGKKFFDGIVGAVSQLVDLMKILADTVLFVAQNAKLLFGVFLGIQALGILKSIIDIASLLSPGGILIKGAGLLGLGGKAAAGAVGGGAKAVGGAVARGVAGPLSMNASEIREVEAIVRRQTIQPPFVSAVV